MSAKMTELYQEEYCICYGCQNYTKRSTVFKCVNGERTYQAVDNKNYSSNGYLNIYIMDYIMNKYHLNYDLIDIQ